MRRFSDLPIAVGFGISTSEHVADVWRYADAAVVGSAIVAKMEELESSSDLISETGRFVSSLIPSS
jgi:tryptophan synthase alpha chain